jgi:cell division protein FtsB
VALSPGAARRGLAAVILLVAGYYAVQGGEYSLWDMLRLRRERRAAEARIATVRAESDSLRREAGRLERQDTAVERIAREQFGMVRDGELLYRFVPADSAKPAAGP